MEQFMGIYFGILFYLSLKGFCYGDSEEPAMGPFFMREPPSNVLIYSQIGATISCSAHGKPAPVMGWERANGTALSRNQYDEYMKIHDNNSLQFLPFSGSLISSIHRAAYRCVAKNSVGKVVSRSVHVKTVKTEDYTKYDVYTEDAWVIKGNTAVFTCDIRPSFVQPYVSVVDWYIGDTRVTNDEKHIILDTSLYILRVDELDDRKQVKCVTLNRMRPSLRKRSRGAVLHVIIKQIETSPRIEYKKESISIRTGSRVVLPCVAYAFPIARYLWTKNGAAISQSDDRINLTYGELQIDNVTSGDSGMYWCNASNKHGSVVISTNLLVTKPLSVKMIPRDQIIDATQPAELHCQVSGGPYSLITWYKNGSPLVFSNNTRRLNDTSLKVLSVSRKDIGMYQCLVSSSSDNVQGLSQLQLGVSAPIIHDGLGVEYKHPGESVSLECQVYGNPPPTVAWTLADVPLLPAISGRIKVGGYMTAEGDMVSHVNITSLRVTDGGKYRCITNNSIGNAEKEAQLQVYGIPVVRDLANKTVVANRTLRLVCHVSGYPVDTISWSRDGQTLRMDHRITVSDDGVLTISSVIVSDEGYYNCSASYSGQGSSARIYVSVITEPVLQPLSFPALTQGENFVATCIIKDGDQPIELSWYRNAELITPSSFPLLVVKMNTPTMSTLSFSSVKTTDIANYTCKASNKAGVVRSTAQLATVNVEPYWVTRPADESVILGRSKQLSCQGAGIPQPFVTWKKAVDYNTGQYRAISDFDVDSYKVLDNGSLLIKNATRNDSSYYICHVSNGIGPGISQTVLLSVNVPATYVEENVSMEALVGEKVELVCNAIGDIPLASTWNRKRTGETRWTQLSRGESPRLDIVDTNTVDGVKSTLTIKIASRSDSGAYHCTCKNDFGYANRLIAFSVREKPKAVGGLEVTKGQSRKVALSWQLTDDGNSPITRYIVQYSLLETGWSTNSNNFSSIEPALVIPNLNPATKYKFRVIAVNSVGQSPPSYEVVTTTAEERPSGSPQSVLLRPLSSSSINVSWLPVMPNLRHGHIRGYRIGYMRINSMEGYSYMTVTSDVNNSMSLVNLDTSTSYSITVAAYNKIGLGPSTRPTVTMTFEDVPSSFPINVTATVSKNAVNVAWKRPSLPYLYGKISGYKLIIHSAKPNQDERDEQIYITKLNRFTVEKLKVYTNYSIQLLVYTAHGDGVRSPPVFVRTPPSPPNQPKQVSASAVNASSVLVSWLPPAVTYGQIQHYQVTVNTDSGKRNYIVAFPAEYILVRDLVQGQVYGFTVRAKNHQATYGAASEEVSATPSTNVVPSFYLISSNIEVGLHQSVLLPCPAVGDPKPSIAWSKGSNEELPEHFTLLLNGTVSVERVLREDAGTFTCTVSNAHGEASITLRMKVLELPLPPIVKVNKALSSSVQLFWISTGNGGFPISGWSLELRNGTNWRNVSIPDSLRSHSLRHLSCGQTYEIRMRAMNREGSSNYSNVLSAKTVGAKPVEPDEKSTVIAVNTTSIHLNLSSWSDNGCPISFYSINYRAMDEDKNIAVSPISPSQTAVELTDLDYATWYTIEITAHNSAGSTTASFHVSTLTADGFTIAPLHQLESVDGKTENTTAITVLVPISIVLAAILILTLGCFYMKRRRNLRYKGENKSRHSMFSDTSDLDPHHPARRQFTMARENMSGDSRVWLLGNHPITGLMESDTVAADKCDAQANGVRRNREVPVSPYAMFMYASARSGDYETCTPTLSFARARMNKEGYERCQHGALKEYCHYCVDICAEGKLLGVEDIKELSTLQLKQYEVSFDTCDDEFPPPPPEALHEYHCEPAGKRCISHEFMRHTGEATIASRPNTTGLRTGRNDTPHKINQYPSCLSSIATVSSNQEELLMAYHYSKVNPPGPILFESPRPPSSSLSHESSVTTEPGIRMFTQSPPRPEESRQAVCEVPIYATTLPSGCECDHSSDTNTDQEPRRKSSRLKSPHRKIYKRKNKKTRQKKKFRDAGDDMSTNSEDCSPYGIPNHSSSSSSPSDKGYGTKNKDTDESLKTSSYQKSRECGDLYEEEEKMSLMQTALGTGETTPPSSQRNIAANFEYDRNDTANTKVIDRYYRTVSADPTNSKPVELYTDDYTIV